MVIVFVAGLGQHMERIERALIFEDLVPGIGERTGAILLDAAFRIETVAVERGGVIGNVTAGQVNTHVGGEAEPLEDAHHIGITTQDDGGTDTDIVAKRLVNVVIEVAGRVELGSRRTAVLAVVEHLLTIAVEGILAVGSLEIDRIDRSHILGRVPDIARLRARVIGAVLVGVGIAGTGIDLHPVVDLVVDAGAERVALEVRGYQDTVLVEITEGDAILGVLVATAQAKQILLTDSVFVGQEIHPVFVPCRDRISTDQAGGRVDDLIPGVVLIRIVELTTHLGGHARRSKSLGLLQRVATIDVVVVLEGFPGQLHKLILVGQVRLRDGTGLHTDGRLEVDHVVAVRAALGGKHDNAVGSTGTVQSGGRSVLEDGHALDVVRVDGGKGAIERNTVHDIQRGAGGVDGTGTADPDGSAFTRLTGTGSRGDTGDHTFQCLGDIGDGTLLEAFTLNCTGRTREGRFLRGTIGHDDGLVERLGVRVQDHVDDSTAIDQFVHEDITDSGELEGPVGRSVQRVCAIHVGGSTNHRTFNRNRGKRDAFPCGSIRDGTRHAHILGAEGNRQEQKQGAEEQFCFFHKHLH